MRPSPHSPPKARRHCYFNPLVPGTPGAPQPGLGLQRALPRRPLYRHAPCSSLLPAPCTLLGCTSHNSREESNKGCEEVQVNK